MRRTSFLRQTFKHNARFREIVGTLTTYGLGDWLDELRVTSRLKILSRLTRGGLPPELEDKSRWERFRLALEELGPTFIKLGQLLSTRTDIVPPALGTELERLQDDVPPFPTSEVHALIQREFGQSWYEMFSSFDPQPIASASIAQVHRAELPSGRTVAVKVQRPNIRDVIETDLDILYAIAGLIERYIPESRIFNPTGFIDDFKARIFEELDFNVEFRSIERFRGIYRKRSDVYIPMAYPDYSSDRVLTMEYVEGIKMSAVFADNTGRFDKQALAEQAGEMILEQVYIYGHFHGDPHPGNLMVFPGDVVCMLDFGSVGSVRPDDLEALRDTMIGIANFDAGKVTEALLELGIPQGKVKHEQLKRNVYDLLETYADRSLNELDVNGLFRDLVTLLISNKIELPTNIYIMTKALVLIESIGLRLNPEFNLLGLLQKISRRIYQERLKPEKIGRAALDAAGEYGELLQQLPGDISELLKSLKGGRLRVSFNVNGLERLRRTLDDINFRLVFGIVLAAVLVSSSLIIQAGVPPLISGIPLLGLIGFAVSGVLGLGLLISMVARVFRR